MKINIKITEKDLIKLMKENPNINIKNKNQLYFKNEKLKGGIKEK